MGGSLGFRGGFILGGGGFIRAQGWGFFIRGGGPGFEAQGPKVQGLGTRGAAQGFDGREGRGVV